MSFSAHPAYSFCLRPFVAHVALSLAIVRCRRGFSSSSSSRLIAIGVVVIRVRPVGPSAVDRLVDRFAARPLVPSCLSGGGEAWLGWFSPIPCGLLLGVSLSCPRSLS